MQTVLSAAILFITIASPVSAQLKKVRFSVSAASIAEVPFQDRSCQRLLSGRRARRRSDLDSRRGRHAGVARRLSRLHLCFRVPPSPPLCAEFRSSSSSLHPPNLNSISWHNRRFEPIQDLKGKVVGISSRGGAVDLLTQLMLQKNGLAPNKDVTSIVVGGQEETVLALRAGRIAAGLFTPPRPLILQREGFTRLAYYRRLHADVSKRRHRRHRRENQNQSRRRCSPLSKEACAGCNLPGKTAPKR